jgi:hypothetical protein
VNIESAAIIVYENPATIANSSATKWWGDTANVTLGDASVKVIPSVQR